MIRRQVICAVALILGMQVVAVAGTVQVTVEVDDPVLVVDQATRLRVSAEVVDGAAGNGIYGYALNVLADISGVFEIAGVTQFGNPLDFISSTGVFMSDGLHDVYGSDGGFFLDPHRGVGGSYELLAVDLVARAVGEVRIHVTPADGAATFGIPDGFLLQQPGRVSVEFGTGVQVSVVSEPGTGVLLLCVGLGMFLRRRAFTRSSVSRIAVGHGPQCQEAPK